MPLLHQALDFVGLDGDGCHEVGIFGFADQIIVFKTDAEVLFRNIDAWFNGEDHARGNRFVWWGDVVDIEAEVMGGAVHEVFLHEGFGLVLCGGLLGGEQAEGDEFRFHCGDDLLLEVGHDDTGTKNTVGEIENAEDRFIN